MNRLNILGAASGLILFFVVGSAVAQDDQVLKEITNLPWQSYPATGAIGTTARVSLTNDLWFLQAAGTSRFLELNGNPPRSDNYTLAPSSLDWFAVFAFDSIGYVKDDEQLDPVELLRVLREQNVASAAERRRLQLPVLTVDGWAVPPHYDVETHRLEWAVRLMADDGHPVVNYTVRLLGRAGVMNAILVSDLQNLSANVQQFKAALRGFDFVPGQKYAEFRQGDRVAEYGLAALIVGGAAAAAAKSGALKGLGKLVGIAVVGGLAAIGAFFKRLFGRKDSQPA